MKYDEIQIYQILNAGNSLSTKHLFWELLVCSRGSALSESQAGGQGATRTPFPHCPLPQGSADPSCGSGGPHQPQAAAGQGSPRTQSWSAGTGVTAPAAERTARHSILTWSSSGALNTEEIGIFIFPMSGFPYSNKAEVQRSCAGSADVLLQEQSQSMHKPALEQMDT